jgi:hypothetical protein
VAFRYTKNQKTEWPFYNVSFFSSGVTENVGFMVHGRNGMLSMTFEYFSTAKSEFHMLRNLKVDRISVGKWIELNELPFADSGPSRVEVV